MPTIVESVQTNAALFTSAIGAGCTVVASLDELKRHLADTPDEYAVVLGPGVDLEAASALADTLRVTRPATSVILVRRRVDTSVLAEALRSGMREVVEERDLAGLGAAVVRARQVWEALHGPISGGSTGGQLITVFSPKGGVGKTTTAVNLALALAEAGQRRVCLVDLDLGFGDVAITLQLFPARTIADTVALESGLDFAVLEPLLTPYADRIATLVAPVQPDARDAIPAALVGRVLTLLKAEFDYVVVDTAPTFDDHVLQAFDETDQALVLTTLDVPTLKNVKIALETLDLLNFPREKRTLVLNRADEKVGLSPAKVEETLGVPVRVQIPTSAQVAHATNAGEPIVVSQPRHPVSQAIKALAAQIVAGAGEGGADRPGGPAGAGGADRADDQGRDRAADRTESRSGRARGGARAAAPRRGLLRRR
jgi:pilus assembly protein CpaE